MFLHIFACFGLLIVINYRLVLWAKLLFVPTGFVVYVRLISSAVSQLPQHHNSATPRLQWSVICSDKYAERKT